MEAMSFEPEDCAVSLRVSVGAKNDNDRGPKISERIYRRGVLEGNWFEDSTEPLPLVNDEWATLFETSYRPYKTELLGKPKFEAWDQRFKTQGIGARLMIDHHGTEYHNNWTTSHDLSYKILPMGLRGPRMREFNASNKEWRPVQDYAQVYGNLTEYGLTDVMKHKWDIENKPMRSWRTNYRDNFPEYENASPFRFLKPKASLNDPDLRHLGIDLLAAQESCPTAFKTPKPKPYNTVLLDEKDIPKAGLAPQGLKE